MKLNIQGERYEVNSENAILFVGDNTLIHGLYVDVEPDDYFFLPTEVLEEDTVEEYLDRLEDEGVPAVELLEYDPEAEPFRFIINGLCRFFAKELDEVLGE